MVNGNNLIFKYPVFYRFYLIKTQPMYTFYYKQIQIESFLRKYSSWNI